MEPIRDIGRQSYRHHRQRASCQIVLESIDYRPRAQAPRSSTRKGREIADLGEAFVDAARARRGQALRSKPRTSR